MIMVTLLLVNMLIAMMGNTYQLVNETQKEWFRQVFNSGILISNTWCETNVLYQEYLMYPVYVFCLLKKTSHNIDLGERTANIRIKCKD